MSNETNQTMIPRNSAAQCADLREAYTVHGDVRGLPRGDSAADQEGRKLSGDQSERQGGGISPRR